MIPAILNGRVDVLIGEPLMQKPQSELARIELKKRPGFFYCRTGHPLLKRRPVLGELASYPFVGFILPSRLSALFTIEGRFGRMDREHGNLIPRVECSSVSTAKRIVAAGDGIGVGTLSMISNEIREGVLAPIPLKVPGLETAYSIFTLSGRTLSPVAQAFVDIVRAVDRETDEKRPPLSAGRRAFATRKRA
jgi:DNA-binding transcriptional LysR family regulator